MVVLDDFSVVLKITNEKLGYFYGCPRQIIAIQATNLESWISKGECHLSAV